MEAFVSSKMAVQYVTVLELVTVASTVINQYAHRITVEMVDAASFKADSPSAIVRQPGTQVVSVKSPSVDLITVATVATAWFRMIVPSVTVVVLAMKVHTAKTLFADLGIV